MILLVLPVPWEWRTRQFVGCHTDGCSEGHKAPREQRGQCLSGDSTETSRKREWLLLIRSSEQVRADRPLGKWPSIVRLESRLEGERGGWEKAPERSAVSLERL